MINLFKAIKKKINGFIWTLFSTGLVLLMLAVLIVWTNFMLRLIMGLLIMVVAYVFFYAAYKVWALKKEIEKHFKL